MKQIQLLTQETIDKIAAGEVIERPASIVKELVENAIDAGSNAITVEIKEGGISFIRITDNGEGIPKEQVRTAFLRHATSKIKCVEDLLSIGSLGFRGEALSSIAAVCQVELITKTSGSLTGVRYLIEGSQEKGMEEIGAPEGSTFLVRNIFYNTPARKKFLKSAATEAGYISDLIERLALSHPEVSFKFINNGQTKIHTSGNCNLKDIIYSIYGRDIASNLLEINTQKDGVKITGFIGKPVVSRGNRNFENYFVNGRYVKSSILAKAIEEGYKTFMMQHRYPFTVLRFEMDGSMLDINVHPTKMELRFADNPGVYQFVYETVKNALAQKELIPNVSFEKEKPSIPVKHMPIGTSGAGIPLGPKETKSEKKPVYPEPFEKIRKSLLQETKSPYEPKYPERTGQKVAGAELRSQEQNLPAYNSSERTVPNLRSLVKNGEVVKTPVSFNKTDNIKKTDDVKIPDGVKIPNDVKIPEQIVEKHTAKITEPKIIKETEIAIETEAVKNTEKPEQLNLFDQKLLSKENVVEHKLIGQVFDTYWLVQFRDNLYIIDQHAAHEKVMYERLTKSLQTREFTSQRVSPPIILTLSMLEETLLKKYQEIFQDIGFEIEHFGGREYSICAVPDNLFGITEKTLFIEMLDSLSDTTGRPTADILNEKLATMACKSAVKGNSRMSATEANALIQELLSLENPYNCPHGRPTIISMSKYKLEKKFKRIV